MAFNYPKPNPVWVLVGWSIVVWCFIILVITLAWDAKATTRARITTEPPILSVCSPYTAIGEACIWQGGVEVPMLTTGTPQYATMMTIVMPYSNPGWQLYSGEFKMAFSFVYLGNCKSPIVYKEDATIYHNEDVCR